MSGKRGKERLETIDSRRLTAARNRVANTNPLEPVRENFQPDSPTAPRSPSGEPVLRYFREEGSANTGRALAVEYSYWAQWCEQRAIAQAQAKPSRVVALLFDMELPLLPTLEQQFAIVSHYVRMSERLLWDGWSDVAVQYVGPSALLSTIRHLQATEYAIYYAYHAQHVVIPTLAWLTNRPDQATLPLLCAAAGKTCAILDTGVDTYAHPHQLLALAAASRANVTTSMNLSLARRTTAQHAGLGYLRNVHGSCRADLGVRQALALWATDWERRGKPILSGAESAVVLRRIAPLLRSGSAPRLTLSALYVAWKLGWPQRFNLLIARALVRVGDMDVVAGQPLDVELLRKAFTALDQQLEEAHAALMVANSRRYRAEMERMLTKRYQPTWTAPWITRGMAEVPDAPLDLRGLPHWMLKRDDFTSPQQILQELEECHHVRDNAEFTAAAAKTVWDVLCTDGSIAASTKGRGARNALVMANGFKKRS